MGAIGTYQLFNAGGDAIGGIMNSPEFPRPAWLFYVNVENIDAAQKRLTEAGGQLLLAPTEVPGGRMDHPGHGSAGRDVRARRPRAT